MPRLLAIFSIHLLYSKRHFLQQWEKIKMYDPLWDDHPKVKKIREESKQQGKIEGLRIAVLSVVEVRFPDLTELAQQEVSKINTPDILKYLMDQLLAAPDETIARFVLHPSAA